MISKRELQEAIESCECAPLSYQNCEKLATLYTIYDHLYTEQTPKIEKVEEDKISASGNSEFLKTINGLPSLSVWSIMDELMKTLQVIQPRLYDGVMKKISDL